MTKREFIRSCGCGLAFGLGLTAGPFTKTGKAWAMENSFNSPSIGPGKFSKESPYALVTPKGIKCQICPNNCILTEGTESLCRTHVVKNNKLWSIAYGNPCSVHIDPIEKKPLFHFLPATRSYSLATAGCNFACLNCQNWEISQVSPRETQNTELFPEKAVEEAVRNKCTSIAYTYSEPIAFYEYMYDIASLARSRGIKNLLISNGFINERPLRDLARFIDAANINLKSFNDDIYARLNGGSLQPVLNTLKILKANGTWLEITNLIVPGWTDDLGMIREMCNWLVSNGFQDNPLHFNRFHPLYKLTSLPFTPLTVLEKAREIAIKSGVKYVYIGNVPGHQAESTYCPECKKKIIDRRGFSANTSGLKSGKCINCNAHISGVWA